METLRLEEEKLNGAAVDGMDAVKAQAPFGADDPVVRFEQELETGYRGTYLFYKKLPAKSQEEVFVEHQQGASIEEVRETIMSRYLHSR